ncbi:unnamed protein product, partial [Discosporangium mesarthrocarpum]
VELDLSNNSITDLKPLSRAPTSLRRLNVAHNGISSVGQMSHLSHLSLLGSLVLSGNPLHVNGGGYRKEVVRALPTLEALDHIPVERAPTTPQAAAEEHPDDTNTDTRATVPAVVAEGRMSAQGRT